MRIRHHAFPTVAVAAFCGLTSIGCDSATAPDNRSVSRPDVRPWVVPALALSLDAEGHFVFPAPQPSADLVIGFSDAVAMATAYMNVVARDAFVLPPGGVTDFVSQREVIEGEHRAPVDWGHLSVVRWVPYFMESPVEPLPDSVPIYVRNNLAPRWHVLFASQGSAICEVAVASTAVDVVLSPSGEFTSIGRGEAFHSAGLPDALASSLPLIPERAVQGVAATGALVRSLPRLLGPWNHFGPVFARWDIKLDRAVPVVVDSSGVTVSTDEILVGLGASTTGAPRVQWFIPAAIQPDRDAIPYPVGDGTIRNANVRFKAGYPVEVVAVHAATGVR